jgi:hypothetical protein
VNEFTHKLLHLSINPGPTDNNCTYLLQWSLPNEASMCFEAKLRLFLAAYKKALNIRVHIVAA